jgi:glycosyltransferase involved in cell wall biosynthesis
VVQIGGDGDFFPGTEKVSRRGPIARLFWRHRCDVVFPYTPPRLFRWGAAKAIGWVYDLQHVDLPQMFDEGEIQFRDKHFQRTLANTEMTLVSSHVMAQRLQERFPDKKDKIRVFRFSAKILPEECEEAIGCPIYQEEKNFFLCPYQLWKHKNHDLLIEALEICRAKGLPQRVLCTGEASDFRDPQYPVQIQEKIRQRGLSSCLCFTGKLPRPVLLTLMIRAKGIVLPSLYEGWSTVLEEGKALGQNCLVSDIAVHREQNHVEARYFRPDRAEELAELLIKTWQPPSMNKIRENIAKYQAIRKLTTLTFIDYLNDVLLS